MANTVDHEFCRVLEKLLAKSESSALVQDRTGTGTYKVFGEMMRIDVSEGFPLLLSRQVPFKSLVAEFLFFLNGYTNNEWLKQHNCKFWDGFAHPDTGELGPVYGAQLRNFNNEGVDQLANLIDGLKNRPNSRRHMFTYFNPAVMPDETRSHKQNIEDGKAVLPPCHLLYQFNVEDGYLDGILYQRSADLVIGSVSNIAQMALWIQLLAAMCGYKSRELVYMTGDTHLYSNHVAPAKRIIENFKRLQKFEYPQLKIDRRIDTIADIGLLKVEDFKLSNYNPVERIQVELSV